MPAKALEEALAAYRRFATGAVGLDLPTQEEAFDGDELSGSTDSASSAAFALYSLLSAPGYRGLPGERESCVSSVDDAILDGCPPPCGQVIASFLRARGRVDFRIVETGPIGAGQWAELSLDLSSTAVSVAPISVFTSRFFYGELGCVFSDNSTPYLHPENDKVHTLREECWELESSPIRFRYFVDATGLAEIVLDRQEIGHEECLFAAALFSRYNGLSEATLDGVRVPRAVTF